MSEPERAPGALRSLPGAFWAVAGMEFLERGAYYGLMSVLSVYLVESTASGGLGFGKPAVGVIKSTIQPLLYALPIVSGAIADRFGYRRCLLVASALLTLGYFAAGRAVSYPAVFVTLLVMALGAGTFKPIISGTIARITTEKTSSLGFGIYYWSINLGAFLFPLFLVGWCKRISWSAVFTLSAASTALMLVPAILFFREPPKPPSTKSVVQVLRGAGLVLKDLRFVSMILVYSGFWVLYFQWFDSVLWYLKAYVDVAPVDAAVNRGLAAVGLAPTFHFDAEHVTVINGGTIIALQLVISTVVKNARPLPTMIAGIGIGTLGFVMLAVSRNVWWFVAAAVVFSIGEMTAHPKYFSYVGQIAPEDKKATYMGYAFLYGFFGSSIGGVTGAWLYVRLAEKMGSPGMLWALFAALGALTMVGLWVYDRVVARPGR
jgi:dipeptide/tripeptide permease